MLAKYFLPLLLASVLGAQNPDDVTFRLRLLKPSAQYSMNEPIEIELSLGTSETDKYDLACGGGLKPGVLKYGFQPADGVVDLGKLPVLSELDNIEDWSGLVNPIACSTSGYVTLSYRFTKPGHYKFSLEKQLRFRGGQPPIQLQSNQVTFEVLPAEATAETDSAELKSVLDDLDNNKSEGGLDPLHRLDLMQTPEATAEKVRRFLADQPVQTEGFEDVYRNMLLRCNDLNLIKRLLENAFKEGRAADPSRLVNLLADLREQRRQP